MTKYAKVYGGKVVDIQATNLDFADFASRFDPKDWWIDVSGQDVKIGYLYACDEGGDYAFRVPDELEKKRLEKLKEIDERTEAEIVGGFEMELDGQAVRFDSDVDTQNTMAIVYAASRSEDFAAKEPYNGQVPVRGYLDCATEKTVFYLNKAQIQAFMDALALHIGAAKMKGWGLQQQAKEAKTIEELARI